MNLPTSLCPLLPQTGMCPYYGHRGKCTNVIAPFNTLGLLLYLLKAQPQVQLRFLYAEVNELPRVEPVCTRDLWSSHRLVLQPQRVWMRFTVTAKKKRKKQ
ncbi:hypothetical protein Zmor_004447 [Zophobas morio]|uniref:Uncharacterized protein n=1 Tax=Zophobas morio TaxID=2755281 RepID=A0AA38HIZ2_9CUCU|nr:hypothetical protein Zmor_004447 [Zophobas morio]